ncbi:protein D2 isoform X2 [Bemisia tabaci]|uniref:protein D2 isoform X2 n=1 Tax=Bemisia tabaci TaxID=7038 RepID=UPI0008F99D4B|nr:PREDICTED: protein D2-like isoform X2 [Bemisia tabaci]
MKFYNRFVSLFLTVRLVKLTEVPFTSTQNVKMKDVLLKDPIELEEDLKYWKIIPDLLKEAPKQPMQAWWLDGGWTGTEAIFGNEINDPEITAEEPFWLEWKTNNDTFHTMMMVGEYLTEYMGPDPPENKGLLRYVFLVYRQPDKLKFKEKKISSRKDIYRTNFSSKAFADKYNLGKPMAINFFRARFEY